MSCDVTNPNNPLPFCDSVTSLHQPCRTLQLRYSILIWLSLSPGKVNYKFWARFSFFYKGKGFVENWPQLQVVSSLTAIT